MASRKDWSTGIGIVDVAANMTAFEVMNNVRLEVRMTAGDHGGLADVVVVVLAHDRKVAIGDQAPLGSVSVSCLGSHLMTVDAVLIHALYLLDGQLARLELEKEASKVA